MNVSSLRTLVASLAAIAVFGAPVAAVAVTGAGSSTPGSTGPAIGIVAAGDGDGDGADHSSWD